MKVSKILKLKVDSLHRPLQILEKMLMLLEK
jgi:hypothetical protein